MKAIIIANFSIISKKLSKLLAYVKEPIPKEIEPELLRAELLSMEQLKRHAISLARLHRINPKLAPDCLLARLSENANVILSTYQAIVSANSKSVKIGQHLAPAETWLLDNYYLIQQQITLAQRHLPRGYSKQLPRIVGGVSNGFPRIYDLALTLISHMDGRVDSENSTQFISAYQSVEPLMLGELWAFPIMLQLALIENLRRVSVRIANRREEQESATIWADRMLAAAESEPKQVIQLLAKFADSDIPLTASFVEEFYAKLQDQGAAMAFVQTWLEQQLLLQHVTATQLLESASRTAAANQISIANSICSLRFIGAMDWRNFVETLSVVEQLLVQDPVNQYVHQDFSTRDRYRHVIEKVAKLMPINKSAASNQCSQYEIAWTQAAIDLADTARKLLGSQHRSAHIGYYLIDEGLCVLKKTLNCRKPLLAAFKKNCKPYRLFFYVGSILLLTALLTAVIFFVGIETQLRYWKLWLLALIGFVGTSALAVSLVNLIVTQSMRPHALPRLDFSRGVPEQHRTMVVIPTLISSTAEIDGLLEGLEIRYLGNRDSNLYFALLTDFRDATDKIMTGDVAIISYIRSGIEALNSRYFSDRPSVFYLFHRQREWNEVDSVWMGYERKRGKLEQFNSLLRDEDMLGRNQSAFTDIVGDTNILSTIQYVITLDTDTQLPRDSARKLIGNMAHPLNRPVFDNDLGRITQGYAILQPRASIGLISANQTWFTKLYAGESGMDPYTREVSDVYQDIFAEGSFVGKGIYDVDAFMLAVDGRFPNNLILSHDLLESGYARSALVSDVDLIEEHPASYAMDISRRHRWVRGDWQLTGWLLPRVPAADGLNANLRPNPLSALSIWKIIDNLRRSLIALTLFSLLVAGWLIDSSFLIMLIIQTIALAVIYLTPLLSNWISLINKPKERAWLAHIRLSNQVAIHSLMLATLSLVFLPYEAAINIDAILRSAGRMLMTKRGLLLWHLPIYAKRNASNSCLDFYKEMWIAPAIALLITSYFFVLQTLQFYPLEVWQFSAPILLLWLLSPLIAWWVSKPITSKSAPLTQEQTVFLQISARRTWRYFDQFVNAEDNWLPPDNVQQYPTSMIASRTSPTNIGMGLLTNLAAYDFGYITTGKLLELTQHTLTSMEKLSRYHGHFYNWYDTRTLQVLNPQYISSVDSGNLAGCLITLQAGLLELKHHSFKPAKALQGLGDTLHILAEHLPTLPAKTIEGKIKLLQDLLQQSNTKLLQTAQSQQQLFERIQHIAQEIMAGIPIEISRQDELVYWANAFKTQAEAFYAESLNGLNLNSDNKRIQVIDDLAIRAAKMAEMDFTFLYDNATDLLSIGFDVGERRRDPSCYDLLASEARLASFLLIAQGQLPQKHWFSLGRLLTSMSGDVSLLSWSGSMFEYLMPNLIMPSFENTLLDQTCKAVVRRQIQYGQQNRVPWGISESCYNATDIEQVYQYRAFGVPGLGFKRGLADDLVIAPYASALALMVMPNEACKNLQKLSASGFVGQYGFYEAIDYTPNRLPRGKNHAAIFTFMAHHQGMSLLSFAQVLLNKPMQRRFMAAPYIKATELLLQERIPKQGATLQPHTAEINANAIGNADVAAGAKMRVFIESNTPAPEVHLLSNGRYHVMATNAGGGYSRWHDLAVTRWREDATQDNWGTFIYVRDLDSQRYWSSAHQPTLRKADFYEAVFSQARAEYRRRDQSIETHTEISVSPEDDVEIRRVTLTNLSARSRNIELTSYAEVILASQNADLAHRSFSNLFVQTEILPDRNAIICTRRPRTQDERVPWMFHLMAVNNSNTAENHSEKMQSPSFETDRAKFIGRGRTAANPTVFDSNEDTKSSENLLGQVSSQISDQLFGRPINKVGISKSSSLSNTDGSVLDPVVAIRRSIHISPDQSATVQIISGVTNSREAALALIDKYGDKHFVERAFEMAWFQSQEVLRMLNASEADAQLYSRLASSIIYCNSMRRAAPSVISRNQIGQSGLWRFGVSGDLPIVLMRIGDINRINLVKQLLQAHTYWRMNGLVADLVIINEDFSGYRADLQDQIIGLINAGPEAQTLDKPGGVYIRRVEELSEEARVLFQTVARIVFTDSNKSLIEQVERRVSTERAIERTADLLEPLLQAHTQRTIAPPKRTLLFDNGLGGFTPDGREYVITLSDGQKTPAPWANVIASPFIGTVVTESGGAYTWVENAHEFRLTTWHNDPVSDSSGEAHYIRDEETGAFWSPTPLPNCIATQEKSDYVCRHGFGYSVFEHTEADISSAMTTYVAMDTPVKFVVIKLRNLSNRTRQLSLTGYWELVMGEWRHHNLMHIVTEIDAQTGAIFARNSYGRECANRIVFACLSEKEVSASGSRAEFIGRNGSLSSPAAMRRKRLTNRSGAGLDPCASLQAPITLGENEEHEFVLLFGAANNVDEARQLIQRFSGRAGAGQALDAVHEYWNHTLGAVQLETPDVALNILNNGWLLYQTISCRLWGRSGYYQSGGAFGFRDQLQDTMALMHAAPWLAREQIIRCAQRQFQQGDVQHWWHPPNGQGVRTHFSDDYLWLAYATCRYVTTTGDSAVLDEQVHFLEGRALNQHEEAYYDLPQRSNESASLYEHCVRAIKHGLRFGANQLPLIGCGDWNDGMNLIGREGKGESVWLAWFLVENLNSFSLIANLKDDHDFAELCTSQAILLKGNIETHAWDGEWYRRAYFDDGSPLGSKLNNECQIDSISQSWAVISKSGDPARAKQAMAAVNQRLVERDAQLIKLLDPPFDQSQLEPGYIKGYVPGVRENGGQYTHAAIWATMAYAMLGENERAWELYDMLNPIHHASTLQKAQTYKVEPYVMSADIYATAPHTGRGGWTWYTGAAGWMYRLTLETLLGTTLENDCLRIAPCAPKHWKSYKVHYRFRDTVYHIMINLTDKKTKREARITLDNVVINTVNSVEFEHDVSKSPCIIRMVDDRQEHFVQIDF